MLIVALVASLVATTTPGTGRGQLKALTLEIAALLRRERLAAILSGRDRHVSLDGERRVLVGEAGERFGFPVMSWSTCWAQAAQAVIMATPEGSQPYRILVWKIDPLTRGNDRTVRGVSMQVGAIWARWIELLAGLLLAWREMWRLQRTLIVSHQDDRLIVRQAPGRNPIMQLISTDEPAKRACGIRAGGACGRKPCSRLK